MNTHVQRSPVEPPATPESSPSLQEMRAAIAPYCAKRNVYALLLLAADLGLFALGQWLALTFSGIVWRLLGALVTWVAIVRLFVIGHDACHQALTSSPRLNRAVGRIAFLVSLTPYSLWRVGHNVVHHGFNNLRNRDFVWEPKQLTEYLGLPRWRRAVERIYRGALGPALYYFVEIWWKKLFFPNRENMPTPRLEFALDSLLAAVFASTWIVLICMYAHGHAMSVWSALLTALVVPFVLWNWTVGLIVYLHHTHPGVHWYATKKDWQRSVGQVAGTVHLVFPKPVGALMHHIMEHPAHHLTATIPLYHLQAAQQQLRRMGAGFVVTRFTLRHYLTCIRECQLYDYELDRWLTFPR